MWCLACVFVCVKTNINRVHTDTINVHEIYMGIHHINIARVCVGSLWFLRRKFQHYLLEASSNHFKATRALRAQTSPIRILLTYCTHYDMTQKRAHFSARSDREKEKATTARWWWWWWFVSCCLFSFFVSFSLFICVIVRILGWYF